MLFDRLLIANLVARYLLCRMVEPFAASFFSSFFEIVTVDDTWFFRFSELDYSALDTYEAEC